MIRIIIKVWTRKNLAYYLDIYLQLLLSFNLIDFSKKKAIARYLHFLMSLTMTVKYCYSPYVQLAPYLSIVIFNTWVPLDKAEPTTYIPLFPFFPFLFFPFFFFFFLLISLVHSIQQNIVAALMFDMILLP